ncbi:glycoside hydrolase domain-containing protein [Liquorilactobacillus hordei]|uniref:Bacteriocin activator n=1 Tax=Liquorilactobacillus hordei DSM 19519 TaxID=1423759 RepID=A0A0R1M715_9LACO|nr:glycoside hydrolase domain-containing protein [Liquorilactobacillus hordei]KRL03900.1 bacteriocin activator [Liquorilactobacillus hordei DSM 19519]
MDQMVLETQQWLNKTYGGVSGFGSVTEDGLTGWGTVYGLTRALQHELGITGLVNNFGPTSKQKFNNITKTIVVGYTGNIAYIIQGGFWCKGITPGEFDGKFSADTASAVTTMKTKAGLADTSSSVDGNFMAALLNMSSFDLLTGGDAKVREMQQQLNHDYLAYTGILPCDGIYQRDTNSALIYALQAEEKISTSVATGAYGATTKKDTPTVKEGTTNNFVRILQWGLYVNNKAYTGAFDGVYDAAVVAAVKEFEETMALDSTDGTSAGVDIFMSLLTSAGNPDRSAIACDTSYQLNATRIATLKNAGYSIVGRYLTGTVGSGTSERAKNLTTDEITAITTGGLKIFPIYQDGASDKEAYFTAAQGKTDGTKAVYAAQDLGFKEGVVIYFAVDADIQAGDIAGSAKVYFEALYDIVTSYGYEVGIYGTRNVSATIISAGLATKAFISDMSTGYSGNLGYSIPDEWAFDQFSEISIGDFAIDKDATTSARETATGSFGVGGESGYGNAEDLAKINTIIDALSQQKDFSYLSGLKIEKTSKEYEIPGFAVDFYVQVKFEASVSEPGDNVGVVYNVSNGKFESDFTDTIAGVVALSDEINKEDINSALTELSSLINNGQIWVEPVTKGSDAGIALHIKSTFDHTLDSGETIELEYEIIIDEIFHKIEVVPTGMDDTTITDYNGIITTGVEIVAGVAVATAVTALAIVGLQALIVAGVGTGTAAGAAEAAGGLAALIAVIKNEKN